MSRNYESNGPDVKIRGNAAHVAEKYVQLARDATASGDSVMAENYPQHAEHYFRIILAAQAQYQPRQDQFADTGNEGDEDESDVQATNGEASEAPQQQAAEDGEAESGRETRRQPRQRRARREEPVEAEAQPETGEAAPEAEQAAGEAEEKPRRTRRPRRTTRRAADPLRQPGARLSDGRPGSGGGRGLITQPLLIGWKPIWAGRHCRPFFFRRTYISF